MELIVLLECLKWLFVGFELVNYFKHRKREKATVEALEKLNHRLRSLEEEQRKLP